MNETHRHIDSQEATKIRSMHLEKKSPRHNCQAWTSPMASMDVVRNSPLCPCWTLLCNPNSRESVMCVSGIGLAPFPASRQPVPLLPSS